MIGFELMTGLTKKLNWIHNICLQTVNYNTINYPHLVAHCCMFCSVVYFVFKILKKNGN